MITTARLPSDCTGGRHGAQKGTSRFDIPGYLFLTITIGCLVFILHMIGEPGSFSPPLVASLTAACALSGAFFILVELYTESNHVVPLRLIPKDGIGLIYLGQILLGCCQFAVSIVLHLSLLCSFACLNYKSILSCLSAQRV